MNLPIVHLPNLQNIVPAVDLHVVRQEGPVVINTRLSTYGVNPVPMTYALTRFWLNSGHQVFVCTELADNPGPSVTNAWPQLAESILEMVPEATPEKSIFIEHYFEGSYPRAFREETFDAVNIHWNGRRAVIQTWERLPVRKEAA